MENFRFHFNGKNIVAYIYITESLLTVPKLNKHPLLHKPYANEVTLTGQNPPWRPYYPHKIFTQFEKGLDLLMLKIWGL